MEKEDSRIVYEQYWNHARHIENELLSFTSFYAVIVAGSFVFIQPGTSKENTFVMLFIMALSIFGFFYNYNLRVPFLKFMLKAELIAINEFMLKKKYRRFFEKEGRLFKDKFVDTYDIFAFLFIAVITFSVFMLMPKFYSILICIPFLVFHFFHKKKLRGIKEQLENLD